MTNEDYERTKELILQMQARFAAGMEELRKAQLQPERVVRHAAELLLTLEKL